MKKSLIVLAAIASLQAMTAFADGMYLGTPSYGGNGCPQGTASAALSPDQQSLSILFDSFSASAGGQTRLRMDRKSCNISIPVHVPQGYMLGIFAIDYRGFNSLPYGTSAEFNVEYFFAGSRGPQFRKAWVGPGEGDFLVHNDVLAQGVVWSSCGADVILRTNANVRVNTNARSEQAQSTVDSMDIDSGLIYHFQWRTCDGRPVASPI